MWPGATPSAPWRGAPLSTPLKDETGATRPLPPRNPDAVESVLDELGQRHLDCGALPSHYHAVTSTLIATLKETVGEAWTDEIDDAWHDGLEAVVSVMIRAHQQRG